MGQVYTQNQKALSHKFLLDIKTDVTFVWEFLIKDNLVLVMHSGARSLCVYK